MTTKFECRYCGGDVPIDLWCCSSCDFILRREQIWSEMGFNPDDKTPFDTDFEEMLKERRNA